MAIVDESRPREPVGRADGYAPIESYAALGDGRTVALAAEDGSVDWLPAPVLSSPSVLGALLDADRGGRFVLAPTEPFAVARRYLPGTNVLETTYACAGGTTRVTDALVLGSPAPGAPRLLARRVEGLSGSVALRWLAEPRPDFGRSAVELGGSAEAVVGTGGGLAVLVQSWGGEPPEPAPGGVGGRIEVSVGETADLLLAVGEQEQPLATWTRDELDVAARETADRWRRWSDALTYEGPWRDAVVRSSLALKLLVHEPTGAIAAAATTSLPEVIGGVRNWDYRFSWIRDASLAVDGMLALGGLDEARGYFDWLEDACHDAAPGLAVLFALDGSSETDEQELPLAGYRRSRPVRTGNAAAEQLQLGVYGEILQTAWLYHDRGHELTERMRSLLAETADLVCELWPRPDRGIWEARGDDFHFTHSKMMCAIALDRAVELAGLGQLAGGNVDRWRTEAARAREFVETRCWSDELGSYCRSADSPGEVDASLLLATILGYSDPADERLAATLAAVRERLGRGPYVYRYRTDDGLPGNEGAFVACSFWVAGALGRMERLDEAAETFESALALGNDLGLFSEEIDPETGAFLGNFPQAFSHLALVNAAVTIARRTS